VLGVLLAAGGLKWLGRFGPGNIPRWQDIALDARVLLFTFGVVVLSSVLVGLIPALRNLRVNLSDSLKEGARAIASHQRLGSALVITEIALSLVLTVGAGLLTRSFARVQQVQPGFVPHQVLSMRLALFGSRYADETRRAIFFRQLLERARELPGTKAAGLVSVLPLAGGISWGGIAIEGYDPAAGQTAIQADQRIASVGYFESMTIPLIRGRYFSEDDRKESPWVAIIDERMARTYWPNANPIGQRLKPGNATNAHPWLTIVGVVASVKQYGLDTESRVAFYTPHSQVAASTMYLTVRTSSDPADLAPAVTRIARAIEPNVVISDVKTMGQWLNDSLARRRWAMTALGGFALTALLLAAGGIYAVMSYTTAQRTREFGVRIALGARHADVLGLVIRRAIRLGLIGEVIGLVGSLAVLRLVSNLLYQVSPYDPGTLAAAAMLLVGVTVLASWLPARRAAALDPMKSLRHE
jgi:predicted permease